MVATGAHFAMLLFCVEVIKMQSAGLANLIASAFGILVSFLGNRFVVFREHGDASFAQQASTFVAFYVAIALLQGFMVFMWTDIAGLNYILGFSIAVVVQFFLGYNVSKRLVFKQRHESHE